jgi:hypothetical protein
VRAVEPDDPINLDLFVDVGRPKLGSHTAIASYNTDKFDATLDADAEGR